MPSEFDLIAKYFTRPARNALLGVGDDCALVDVPAGEVLSITTDMLVEGTHFLPDADANLLGHKSLAVNLSDLAAMGATPRWFTLSLALSQVDEAWLTQFSEGLFALADEHNIELIGGDTTRGPLTISITAAGSLPAAQALRRDGAKVGDDVWVSGYTGDAALGFAHLQKRVTLPAGAATHCVQRLHQPQPRIALGKKLRGVAASAADVSDGLLADLGHILERSGVSADIELATLPRSAALSDCPDYSLAEQCLIAGGDDYELVFTAHTNRRADVVAAGRAAGIGVTRIGRIVEGPPIARLLDVEGRAIDISNRGFDHFRGI
ncbi:MAG TPA: thiamine-phosphate kinase [Burkholderiales bacterium]|nr:thiamine-phosphate kinase [Burkholderiales bacterium]